jgi:hypothetical protein
MNATKKEIKDKLESNQEEIKASKEWMEEEMRTGRAEMCHPRKDLGLFRKDGDHDEGLPRTGESRN